MTPRAALRYAPDVKAGLGVFLLLAAAAGCTGAPAAAPPRAPALVSAPAPPAATEARAEPPPRAPAPNRCLPHGSPQAPPVPEVAQASTCADDRKLERVIGAKIAHRYEHSIDGSVVDVSFACDPITSDVEELVFETGSGHGGSLAIWRLSRSTADSEDAPYRVLGIAHNEPWQPYDKYTYAVADRFSLKIAHGTLPARVVDRAIAAARPALTANPRELEPPPLPNGIRGMRMSSSSGDFHDYVRIRDHAGHVLEGDFSGYPGTSDQPRYLGLELAMESLTPLVEKIPFDAEKPNDEERAFFVRQMLDARDRLNEHFAWWVRERFVRLAGRMGTAALIPVLLDALRDGKTKLDATKPDERKDLAAIYLADPIVALWHVSGWDARYDADGNERPIEDVAKDYLDECARALAP